MPLTHKSIRSSRLESRFSLFPRVFALIVAATMAVILYCPAIATQVVDYTTEYSGNVIALDRLTQPICWRYNDHPIAEPIFLGRVHPIVWGLLILLGTLYSAIALTRNWSMASNSDPEVAGTAE